VSRFPAAVIDLGSNSARVVVFRKAGGGVLEVVADEHISLKLIREIGKDGRLSAAGFERTLRVLRDFRRIADSAGAQRLLAFGTSALRDAKNGAEFRAAAARECGVKLEIMSAAEEAQAGFVGAVYGLPVTDGLMFDIGGGSVQITHFQNRRRRRACSLPLGALRVSDDFLRSDPPSPREIRKLRAHIASVLREADIGALGDDEMVIGTGGTVRNLAKVDSRRGEYPISRLHGYELGRGQLRELERILSSRTVAQRKDLSGLNSSRAESILGGCIVAEGILTASGCDSFLVAGQGLREGVVLDTMVERLPAPMRVREQSMHEIASRFSSCEPLRAARRRAIVLSLYDCLEKDDDPLMREMLGHAAGVLDIGRSIDFYRLHEHTAAILRASALLGFSHTEIALLSSIVELGDPDGWDPAPFSPPLDSDDFDALERAGVLLCLAGVIEERRLPGRAAPAACSLRGKSFTLAETGMKAWKDDQLSNRFRKAFGKELKVIG
jgi:exopolyphosphatase/guanosine-5'-triphosphate,3'-diphosphate pyrophosphatase